MKSQTQRLEEYLLEHGSIHPLQSWLELGIYRLSARINDLRKHMKIETKRIDVVNQFGEIVNVANYVVKKCPDEQGKET